jgi:hypothetical protein
MAKINRSKLNKIIQEEVKKAVIEEGFLDTFKILGTGLKKWYKDAEMQGDVVGSERDSRKAVEATKKAIEANLNKLRTKYGPDGERGDEGVKARMGELKAQFDALDAGGDGASQVVDAIADASDGTVEAPSQNLDQVLAKYGYKGPPESGKPEEAPKEVGALPQEAPPKAVQAAVMTQPLEILELAIDYLGSSTKVGKKTAETIKQELADGSLKLTDLAKLMRSRTRRLAKKKATKEKASAEEGTMAEDATPHTRVSRAGLREAIRLLQENGI